SSDGQYGVAGRGASGANYPFLSRSANGDTAAFSARRSWKASRTGTRRRTTLEHMPLLDGRRALIFGVANRRSIAWAIAQALAREGAELAFTFQGERIEKGVRDLATRVNSPLVVPADVTSDADLDRVFEEVDKTWGGLDILVHSVAFAPPSTFEHPFAE